MIFGFSWTDLFFIGLFIFFAIMLVVILIAITFKVYNKCTNPMFNSDASLSGKTVLITGANSGIGKETARYMAKKGARVIMACRTMSTAKVVRDEIAAESENTKIILHHVDLSSLKSVREFCARVIETEPKIDILIHNAGFAAFLRRDISTDGIDYSMAANHYGPFLMTMLLMDLMKKSAPSRIVNVGSKAHTLSFLNPENPFSLNPVGSCWPISFFNYSNSKMATLLSSSEMARQLHGTGVTVNTLHPGAIDTEIWRNYPFLIRLPIHLSRMFLKNLNEGIQTTLYVALSTNLTNVSGAYFRNCNLGKPHKDAENIEWQKFMFDESMKIIKLANNDHFV